ncbi:MAG: DUF3794 and LysM peptidoglycan-binding domain-containing protein [Bacillota bacterium]
MAVELIRDLLKIDQVIGEEETQAIVEGDIVVPDVKPDISRILSVDGIVNITGKEAVQDKIIVDGVVHFKILYAAEDEEQPVYSMNASAGFSQNIDIENTTPSMDCIVSGKIEHIDYNVVNERKVSVKTVLNLSGKTWAVSKMDVLREIRGLDDVQLLRDYIRYNDLIGSSSGDTIVRESFELEESLPEIKEVLRSDAYAIEKETKVTDGKVIVSGMVKANTLYVADDARGTIILTKHEMPFTHFVEVPGAVKDMDSKVNLKVDEVYTDIKQNIDGDRKILELEAVVNVNAVVNETEHKEIVVDAYSPSKKLKVDKKTIAFNQSVGSNSSNVMVKETLEIPKNQPEAFKVFHISTKPIITDYRLVEDKNIIEGVIEANAIYLSQDKEQHVHSFRQEVPFRHFIDIPGADEAMNADIDLYVNDVDYSLINPQQIEVKFQLGTACTVTKKTQMQVLIGAEESGEIVDVSKQPSITIYFVQPGDTLWKIAKRYNTTVSDLIETNDIQNPNMITSGDRIIVQKTYEYKF